MINNSKLVSIGIPFYNADSYLEYAILSVLNQSYNNWELILLDDGSTDNSLEIAKRFSGNNPRIRVYSDGINKGLPIRLNEITKLAKGYYYCRMDSDDIMTVNRLEKQIKYLEENPNVDVIGGGCYSIDNDNNIKGIRIPKSKIKSNIEILKHSFFIHPTVIGKTEWFKSNPYNSIAIRMEDKELWLRTIPKSEFYNLQQPVIFYRELGVPTFNKYKLSNLGVVKILNQYKDYGLSFINARKYQIMYFIKIFIYGVFSLLKKTEFLIRKRNQSIVNDELNVAKDMLNKAINKNE